MKYKFYVKCLGNNYINEVILKKYYVLLSNIRRRIIMLIVSYYYYITYQKTINIKVSIFYYILHLLYRHTISSNWFSSFPSVNKRFT